MTSLAIRLDSNDNIVFVDGKTNKGYFKYRKVCFTGSQVVNLFSGHYYDDCIDAVSAEFGISKPLAMIWLLNYTNTLEEIQELKLTDGELHLCYMSRTKISNLNWLTHLVFKIKERPNIPWYKWSILPHVKSPLLLEAQTVQDIELFQEYNKHLLMKHIKPGWSNVSIIDYIYNQTGLSKDVVEYWTKAGFVYRDLMLNVGLFKEMDIRYVENTHYGMTLIDVFKAGMTHRKLYNLIMKTADVKIPYDVFLKSLDLTFTVYFRNAQALSGCYNWKQYLRDKYNINTETGYLYYANTYMVAEWAIKHHKWSSKVNTYKMDDGSEVKIYNHHYVEYITDEMLKSGLKTSPSVIEEALRERINTDVLLQLKKYTDLPVFERTIKNDCIKQIVTVDQLVQEGTNMNHCVTGYINKIAHKQCYIFHVDDGTEHGATVEVVNKGSNFKVVQCRTYANGSAPKAYEIACKEFN